MKNLKLLVGLFVGAGVYRFLMWGENLGLNAFIFAVLLVAALFSYKMELRRNKLLWWLAGGFIVSAAGVAITGIVFSAVVYYTMLIVFLAFVQMPALRSAWYALLLLPYNSAIAVWLDLKLLGDACEELFHKRAKQPKRRFLKLWQIFAIGGIALLFVGIFSIANPQFARFVNVAWNGFCDLLRWLIPNLSFWSVVHFLFVLYFLSLFFLRFNNNMVSREDMQMNDNLQRVRQKQYRRFLWVGLKSEYYAAFVGIVVFSLLLLTLNIFDIISVWAGITPDSAAELSQFVHRGTYALIVSVILSGGILLFYFRKNLNFYPDNRWFKAVAYSWIGQNIFLLCSTGLRNWHYITECGLTYKRIGVFIFLLMVCVSMVLLVVKIRNKKSHYHFFRMSVFLNLGLLALCAVINWDVVIASYNTSCISTETDYNYLKHLSYQAAPYALQESADETDNTLYRERVEKYVERVKARSWKSFNLGDCLAARKLQNYPIKTTYTDIPTFQQQ
ncbi:MAG: DUF4173 domain-containing protein [Prevotellaceae bacterium]|jgi:hypothetical protein|nr:DUF4173 domain-containing protein [Prevotellaceae bacterium]